MIAVFLIGAAIVLLLFGFYYQRHWYRALFVQVRFTQPHVYARETFELTEVIENRKKLSIPILEIGFRVPRGLHFKDAENTLESDFIYKRDLFAVAGMERIIRRYPMTALQRGRYRVSQLTCQAPSRLFHRTYLMDPADPSSDPDNDPDKGSLYVYPAHADCRLLLHAVEVVLGEQESARRVIEDPFVFASIRPYTIYDPMKTINWKATAKTGSLMVNTYASTRALRVRIFLDVSKDPGNPFSDTLRELGISIAASLIRNLGKNQKDASLLVNCQPPDGKAKERFTFLPSCLTAGGMTAAEEFLTTDFDTAPLLPFEEMLLCSAGRLPVTGETSGTAAQMPPSGDPLLPGSGDEISVFITAADRPVLRTAIHTVLGNDHAGILAILCRTQEHRREEHERNLHILPVWDRG